MIKISLLLLVGNIRMEAANVENMEELIPIAMQELIKITRRIESDYRIATITRMV